MKLKYTLFLSILLSSFSYNVIATEQYICTANKSTGFSYNKATKEWNSTHFKADSKYLFSTSKDKKYTYKVSKFGSKSPVALCNQLFSDHGSIQCNEGFGTDFRFNKENGRYLFIMGFGYYFVRPDTPNGTKDEGSDTPFMEIGKCLPF